jgi:hypothetical protein
MSMICNLRRASPDDLTRLLAHPDEISRFLYGVEESGPGTIRLLWALVRRKPPSMSSTAPVAPPPDDATEDVDKAWHGLHFLFTGTAWDGEEPACYLVTGGEAIGTVDVGYGPARALAPDRVREFAGFLASLSRDELTRRYDPERMAELRIYPETWTDDADEMLAYLLENFETLRDFVTGARDAGEGLLVYLD